MSGAPLFAWGEALREQRGQRRRVARRGALLAVGIGLIGMTIVTPPAPRLVWNVSASAPVGLYGLPHDVAIEAGDTVIARVPDRYRSLAAHRGYLPANVPLVKRVAGVAGDEVCALQHEIFVNGKRAAARRAADGQGRQMPRWTGCIRLRNGQFLLLMSGNPASFDGRYFGISKATDILGKAQLLWAPAQGSRSE